MQDTFFITICLIIVKLLILQFGICKFLLFKFSFVNKDIKNNYNFNLLNNVQYINVKLHENVSYITIVYKIFLFSLSPSLPPPPPLPLLLIQSLF